MRRFPNNRKIYRNQQSATAAFIFVAAASVFFFAGNRQGGVYNFKTAVFAQSKQSDAKIQLIEAAKPVNFRLTDDSVDKKIEPSAVEAIGDGTFLLVADDKDDQDEKSLAVVEAASGKVFKRLQLPNIKKNPKWEGMARDGADFYVIGSYSVKVGDDAAKLANRSHLFRFRLKNANQPPNVEIDDAPNAVAELDITESLAALKLYNRNPPLNPVKIEGLAVRRRDGKRQLLIGLREPSAVVSVYSAEITDAGKLDLKPFFSFAAGAAAVSDNSKNVPYKLSSIEYYPPWNGFFIITSTEDEKNRFHGNVLWFVGEQAIKNAHSAKSAGAMPFLNPQMLWTFGQNMKAEGFCLLAETSSETVAAAIVYDNDTEDTFGQLGLFGTMQIVKLTRPKE